MPAAPRRASRSATRATATGTRWCWSSPLQVLLGYERVHVRAGQTVSVDVAIEPSKFQFADAAGNLRDAAGEWAVWLGPRRADTQTVALRL